LDGALSTYIDREQTQAKHFILRRYLQELAFKVLHGWDITYIDGFSGPWQSKTDDFSDTSFMIAIEVLKDAQARIVADTGKRRRIRCFFSENDPAAYAQLAQAVAPHNKPSEGFEVQTFCGKFEDAVQQIHAAIGGAFPLIFIDPTGWTGYPFQKIKSIFGSSKCEVLINFMYGHISRFVTSQDEGTIASLNPILGGPGWWDRLDKSIPPGPAAEKLFRETLKQEGNFRYVISTKIDKSTADRPHFFLAYGTKDRAGLKAFRQTEYDALRQHAKNRANAKERKREARTQTSDLFAGVEATVQEASIDQLIEEQKKLAADQLRKMISGGGAMKFANVVDALLEAFMLRETNVKDICAKLAKEGAIQNTWGIGNRRPTDDTIIRL
jgi:three-Cys-motif partner protein